ncbi:MAG: formyltransferase family protein [Pseudomonadota bacterium]
MLRFGFVTCVQLGLTCMEAIEACGGRLQFAGTLLDEQARAKSGRVYLDDFCARTGIPLTKFRNVNDPDAVAAIAGASLDWLFIVGWSQIARAPVLNSTRSGVLGMHPSLLPVGRGRAAVPWAIILGLTETGVTLFKMDEGVDTGPIVSQIKLPLSGRETATSLYQRVDDAHRTLMVQAWPSLALGELTPIPQDNSRATVWEGRTPAQGRLGSKMTVNEADRLIRAVTRPYPGAFFDMDSRRLRVWAAHPAGGSPLPPVGTASTFPSLEFQDGTLQVDDGDWEVPVTIE